MSAQLSETLANFPGTTEQFSGTFADLAGMGTKFSAQRAQFSDTIF
jgi:hypothetical protein